MQVIRPNEPEFNFHELFPGNLQPRPIAARSLDPETVRTALNIGHDNFSQQRRFNREMNAALAAVNVKITTLRNWAICGGILLFGMALLGLCR